METFDTTHNFTWIATRQPLARQRQHSASAWYPFDQYTVNIIVEALADDTSTLPIYFTHLYAGLSGYHVRVEAIRRARTSRGDAALYLNLSIQVRDAACRRSEYGGSVLMLLVAALQRCQALCG